MTEQKLVFLHVPKSAGSTIKKIFRKQYKKETFFLPGKHPDLNILKDRLTSKNNIALCFGHMDFGIHDIIGEEYKYATIVRSPVERVISHYYYVKREPSHYLYNQAFKEKNFSLAQYVESGLSSELNNGQVRMLIGAGGFHKNIYTKYKIPFGKCEPWMLEEAKENIEKYFVFCGVQEKFDESLILMKKKLNWKKSIGYVSQNITPKRKKSSEFENDTLDIIRKYNSMDIELYEWINNRVLSDIKDNEMYIEHELKKMEYSKMFEHYKHSLNHAVKDTLKKILRIG